MSYWPYSPDLSLNDFFLFPNAKPKIRGQRFSSLQEAFENHVFDIPTPEWKECFENWVKSHNFFIRLINEKMSDIFDIAEISGVRLL